VSVCATYCTNPWRPARTVDVVALHDGNGWVDCRCGDRHWGLHGAAGLVLVAAPSATGEPPRLLLQLRAAWTHQGGTWGVPGGARDSHESVEVAAVREAGEEVGVTGHDVALSGRHPGTDHGDWSYTYVLATAAPTTALAHRPVTDESDRVAWVRLDEVDDLPLHPSLAQDWPGLARRLRDLDR
jgi:8-oxo-dGTP diphosphatase